MRRIDIEAWALRVIQSVENGQPHEDSRIEIKADWIPAEQAARRLAGHANAARGGPILWLFGVHERKGIVGVDHEEMATWFPQVKAQFDAVAPDMVDINIPIGDVTVVALYFETDRAPFVIKNPVQGSIKYEVPWREGTQVRSAQRRDLINLLVPLQKVPQVEGVDGKLSASITNDTLRWHLYVYFYITPLDDDRVVIPRRKSSVIVECPGILPATEMERFGFYPKTKGHLNRATDSEAFVHEPGTWSIESSFTTPMLGGTLDGEALITVHLFIAPSGEMVSETLRLPPVKTERNELQKWASGDLAKRRIL